jgi:hypothetical protein
MTTRPDSFSDAKELSRLDDPAVWNRCVKLDRRSNLQAILLQMTILLLVVSFFLLMQGYAGTTSRRGRHHPPTPALIPYGVAALVTSLAALAGFFCCRNYYLLDPVAHRLYHHFQFLMWRRRRIVFRQEEILGITTEGRRQHSKYSTYWTYRLIAVGMDGRQEPLSDWKRHGLETWNAKARALAEKMGCQSYAAPPESSVSVEATDGTPVLLFGSPPSILARNSGAIVVLVILVVILVAVAVYSTHVVKTLR